MGAQDNTKHLDVDQATAALNWLRKPSAPGEPPLALSLPNSPEGGKLQLEFPWFWALYQAMA